MRLIFTVAWWSVCCCWLMAVLTKGEDDVLDGVVETQSHLRKSDDHHTSQDHQDHHHHRALGWHPGTCCNESGSPEYVLIDGKWQVIQSGECKGIPHTWDDCDGMTCGGGFYAIYIFEYGTCRTPCKDDRTFRPRRWLPTSPPGGPAGPGDRGGSNTALPPGYVFGPCVKGVPPKQTCFDDEDGNGRRYLMDGTTTTTTTSSTEDRELLSMGGGGGFGSDHNHTATRCVFPVESMSEPPPEDAPYNSIEKEERNDVMAQTFWGN